MQVREELRGDHTVVWVNGRVDVVTAPELQRDLDRRLVDCKLVVLELSGVDYLSSAGLRVLLTLVRRPGKALRLCSLTPAVADVLEVSGLLPVFTVVATLEQALAT